LISPFVLPVAALLLVADPAPNPAPDAAPPPLAQPLQPQAPQQTQAQQLATALGRTVGEAKECAVDADRTDAAIARAETMVSNAGEQDGEDEMALDDLFHEAMEEGRDAVLDETVSCETVSTELAKIEGKDFGDTPNVDNPNQ
jgi:hypothetical protein